MNRQNRLARLVATAATLLLGLPAIATATATSNPATYPLDTCIISGERLGEEGDPVSKVYDGREVRFCCKMCVGDFEKDPASHLGMLDQAIIDAQLEDYPLETCVVSGEPLEGDMGGPVDHVMGNRLVRLCCKSCKKDLAADPTPYLEKLDAAVVAAQRADYPAGTCPISGMELGAMGEPYDYVYAGRLVRFCCAGCIDSFDENPEAAMATVYGGAAETPEMHEHAEHAGHGGHAHDHQDTHP